jgi:hypothetical protein
VPGWWRSYTASSEPSGPSTAHGPSPAAPSAASSNTRPWQQTLGRQRLERDGLRDAVGADGQATQRPQVRSTAERGTEVGRQRADVRARRAGHVDRVDAGLHRRAHRKRVDPHGDGGPLDLDTGAGQLVQPPALDLLGRHHRGNLIDRPGEPGRRGSHVGEADPGHVPRAGDVARGVQCRRRGPQHNLAHVALVQARQERQQSGGPSDAQHEDAGGVGIEGPRVPHLARPEQPAGLGHHVVGRPARRLVDDGDAVGAVDAVDAAAPGHHGAPAPPSRARSSAG